METILSLLIGIGLSAACGFRVFVPLLVVSVASHTGHLHLSSGFEWMGSDAALIAFAVATVLEVAAYYIPWLDNLLDTVASPAAVIAGTLVTASLIADCRRRHRGTGPGNNRRHARRFNCEHVRPGQSDSGHGGTGRFAHHFHSFACRPNAGCADPGRVTSPRWMETIEETGQSRGEGLNLKPPDPLIGREKPGPL